MAEVALYDPVHRKLAETLSGMGVGTLLSKDGRVQRFQRETQGRHTVGREIVFNFLTRRPDILGYVKRQYQTVMTHDAPASRGCDSRDELAMRGQQRARSDSGSARKVGVEPLMSVFSIAVIWRAVMTLLSRAGIEYLDGRVRFQQG